MHVFTDMCVCNMYVIWHAHCIEAFIHLNDAHSDYADLYQSPVICDSM